MCFRPDCTDPAGGVLHGGRLLTGLREDGSVDVLVREHVGGGGHGGAAGVLSVQQGHAEGVREQVGVDVRPGEDRGGQEVVQSAHAWKSTQLVRTLPRSKMLSAKLKVVVTHEYVDESRRDSSVLGKEEREVLPLLE